jgi:hypothetical protein
VLEEPRLADAGGAFDHDDGALTPADGAKGRANPFDLRLALEQAVSVGENGLAHVAPIVRKGPYLPQ